MRRCQLAITDLQADELKVTISACGVDVGTNITGGHRRAKKKLGERIATAKRRAIKVDELTRVNKKCRRMGTTGVAKAHSYGSTANGASEKEIKAMERNMAIASGRGLRKGASATLAIEWIYGRLAQPDITAHMGSHTGLAQVLLQP